MGIDKIMKKVKELTIIYKKFNYHIFFEYIQNEQNESPLQKNIYNNIDVKLRYDIDRINRLDFLDFILC